MHTRARVIAATNRDPAAAVRQGRLREDLYRLRVFPIHLPPLRDRLGDLTALALHFLHELNERHHTDKTLAPTLSAQMHEHAWPGNVHELKHFVQQAYVLADLELERRCSRPMARATNSAAQWRSRSAVRSRRPSNC